MEAPPVPQEPRKVNASRFFLTIAASLIFGVALLFGALLLTLVVIGGLDLSLREVLGITLAAVVLFGSYNSART